jgi:hypothetical protein
MTWVFLYNMSSVKGVTEGLLGKKGLDDGLYEVKIRSLIVLQCGVLCDYSVGNKYFTNI